MSHARLSPSDKLWPKCPGYLNLKQRLTEEGKYIPKPTGGAAIEGTGVHLLIEMSLLQGKQPSDFKGEIIGVGHHDKPRGWIVTDDRIQNAEYMFAYLMRHPGKVVEPESRSNPGEKFGRDDWYGTADVTIKADNYLEVTDYKNGRMFVPADADNSQLISYGYGKWSGEENVRLTIVQPKTTPPIRYVDITGVELEAKAKELNEAAKLTDDPNAPCIKGDWCDKDWCPLKEHCTVYNAKALEIISDDAVEKVFNDLITELPTMSNSRIAKILDSKKSFEQLYEKVEAEAQLRLDSGSQINGWAMKPGRSSRDWDDEEELIKFLKKNKIKKADYTETKLLSPAKLEKLVDSSKLEPFIKKSEGKLKLTKVKSVKF